MRISRHFTAFRQQNPPLYPLPCRYTPDTSAAAVQEKRHSPECVLCPHHGSQAAYGFQYIAPFYMFTCQDYFLLFASIMLNSFLNIRYDINLSIKSLTSGKSIVIFLLLSKLQRKISLPLMSSGHSALT